MANFYFQNKHLFEDDDQQAYGAKLDKFEQYLSKPKNNPNFPSFNYPGPSDYAPYSNKFDPVYKEPQQELPKNVFSLNARNLLGNSMNDKYEPLQERSNHTAQIENRFNDRTAGNYPLPHNSSKPISNPLKQDFSYANPTVDSLRDIDRPNPLGHLDTNARAGVGPGNSFQDRNRAQNSFNKRTSIPDLDPYGAVPSRNFIGNTPPDLSRRPDPVAPSSMNQIPPWQNNNDKYLAMKRNLGLQPQEQMSGYQNDSNRNEKYTPVKYNREPQPVEQRGSVQVEDNMNKNMQNRQDYSGLPPRSKTMNENSGQKVRDSSTKVVSSTQENRNVSRFPHDDFQALKRRFGIKIDDSNPFQQQQQMKPQMLPNMQARLDQLNSIKGKRTLGEALERRILTYMVPDRKERLKALMKK